jgi:hypothetical protein
MEDAMRDLMGPPARAPAGEQTTNHNWQGGNEHVLMDASYYLDDLLRNMQGNAVDGDTPGGIRGASQLQVSLRLQRLLVHLDLLCFLQYIVLRYMCESLSLAMTSYSSG